MIVGLCGQAGSGKDTVADFLVRDHGFVKIAFADPIKRAAADWFGWDEERLWGVSDKRNEEDPEWGLTSRHVLQFTGTEVGRVLHEEVWVRYAFRIARRLLSSGVLRGVHYDYSPAQGLITRNLPSRPRIRGVVISDVRFQNEVELLQKNGAKVVRIVRTNQKPLAGGHNEHASESEQRGIPDSAFDHFFINGGKSLDLLEAATAGLVETLGVK